MKKLRKELHDIKVGVNSSFIYEAKLLSDSNKNDEQFRVNLKNDIKQVEFLIWCLKNQEAIENNSLKITMAKLG